MYFLPDLPIGETMGRNHPEGTRGRSRVKQEMTRCIAGEGSALVQISYRFGFEAETALHENTRTGVRHQRVIEHAFVPLYFT